MKQLYFGKEVAAQMHIPVKHVNVLAQYVLKKEKIGRFYMFNKNDIKRLKELLSRPS